MDGWRWLGPFWKSCVFVPTTFGSDLNKRMQLKEEESRAGGREAWPFKIFEMAGKTLERTRSILILSIGINAQTISVFLALILITRLTAEGTASFNRLPD